MRFQVLCLRVALWNILNLWEKFCLSIAICSAQFSYLQSVLRNQKTIITFTIICHVFLVNIWKIKPSSTDENLKNIDLLSKPVWQVFISNQSVTALMQARKHLTHASLSLILIIILI